MQRAWLFAVVCIAPIACGQFLAAEGSGGSSGTSSGGTEDAASDSIPGAIDGATGESDGAVADAPYVPTPCVAKFCSPFDDEVGSFPFNWDRVGPSAGASAGILGTRNDTFVSGPRALRIETTSSGALEQWLEKTFDTAMSGSIDLAMRVDAVAGPVTNLRFLALNCDSGGDAARIILEPDRKLSLSTADDNFTAQTSVAVPFKSWVGLRVEFAYDGASNVTSRLTFAGATTTAVVFDNCQPPFKMRLGATLNAQGVFDVSFDDVAVDWSP
jgi:hypothetical protein